MNPGRPRPVLIVGAIVTAINAVLPLVTAFGFGWTGEQVAAVSAAVAALSTVVGALYAQTQVTPLSDPVTNAGTALVPLGYEKGDPFGE